MSLNRLHLWLLVLLLCCCCCSAGEKPFHRFDFKSPHMGTLFTVTLFATDQETAEKATDAAFHRIAQLDEIMSDYQADSELMKLCDEPVGKPVPISWDLFDVLTKAQGFSRISDGAFDVTVGPYVR